MVCGLQLASPLMGPNYLYTCNISPTNEMEVIFLSLNYTILINRCIHDKISTCLYAFNHNDKIWKASTMSLSLQIIMWKVKTWNPSIETWILKTCI
jgi:hypothetical protein